MVLKNFIVFEGIDGSGTSTQIKKLRDSNPEKYIQTAEPTTGETGRFLRRILSGEIKVDEKTSTFLFAADRCEHLYGENGIIELLKQGKSIISDRYLFSSLAYQSVKCGKDLPRLLNSTFPLPEYLFYFEIKPELSLARVTSRGEKKEIYENLETQKKTAGLYEEVIQEYEKNPQGMKIIRLDASKSIEEVYSFIQNILNKNS
ncbi:MAG: dTMP kinase [Treponema sp.]|nr:dTMP kinase [Treponema sp.]